MKNETGKSSSLKKIKLLFNKAAVLLIKHTSTHYTSTHIYTLPTHLRILQSTKSFTANRIKIWSIFLILLKSNMIG